jgi:hypothetical protein
MLKKYFYYTTLVCSALCASCFANDMAVDVQQLKTEAEIAQGEICDQFLTNPDLSDKKKKKIIKKLRKLAKKADKNAIPESK